MGFDANKAITSYFGILIVDEIHWKKQHNTTLHSILLKSWRQILIDVYGLPVDYHIVNTAMSSANRNLNTDDTASYEQMQKTLIGMQTSWIQKKNTAPTSQNSSGMQTNQIFDKTYFLNPLKLLEVIFKTINLCTYVALSQLAFHLYKQPGLEKYIFYIPIEILRRVFQVGLGIPCFIIQALSSPERAFRRLSEKSRMLAGISLAISMIGVFTAVVSSPTWLPQVAVGTMALWIIAGSVSVGMGVLIASGRLIRDVYDIAKFRKISENSHAYYRSQQLKKSEKPIQERVKLISLTFVSSPFLVLAATTGFLQGIVIDGTKSSLRCCGLFNNKLQRETSTPQPVTVTTATMAAQP